MGSKNLGGVRSLPLLLAMGCREIPAPFPPVPGMVLELDSGARDTGPNGALLGSEDAMPTPPPDPVAEAVVINSEALALWASDSSYFVIQHGERSSIVPTNGSAAIELPGRFNP